MESTEKIANKIKSRRPSVMKKIVLFLMACLIAGGVAYAQQDPDDPGIQDSLIIGSVHVDSGITFAFVPIFGVTDDSVASYNLPLKWFAPNGGVYVGAGTQYFPPLTSWDERYDTVMLSDNYVRQIGWSDLGGLDNPCLITNGLRVNAWTLRFVISPTAHSQLIVLDTCTDDRNGPANYGLKDGRHEITPGFQRGFISIGGQGTNEDVVIPGEYALKQNYPNPFNPQTNIEFSLPTAQFVSISVFNLLGQQVRSLVNDRIEAGNHTVCWNGKNDLGVDVPSGMYFYKLYTPEFSQTNKMLMLR
jgi:hypothetical protein